MSNFSKVGIFMKTFGQEVKIKPSFSTDKINKLRFDLIKEELTEFKEALDKKDLIEVPKTILDNMEVITVKSVEDVLKIALTRPFKRVEWVDIDNNVDKSKSSKSEVTSRH